MGSMWVYGGFCEGFGRMRGDQSVYRLDLIGIKSLPYVGTILAPQPQCGVDWCELEYM